LKKLISNTGPEPVSAMLHFKKTMMMDKSKEIITVVLLYQKLLEIVTQSIVYCIIS
jgi:hypothetical protein